MIHLRDKNSKRGSKLQLNNDLYILHAKHIFTNKPSDIQIVA